MGKKYYHRRPINPRNPKYQKYNKKSIKRFSTKFSNKKQKNKKIIPKKIKHHNFDKEEDDYFQFNNIITSKKNINIDFKPDWMSAETKNIKNVNDRFNKEIQEYVKYITPKNISLIRRNNTLNLLSKIIKEYKPEWKVRLFGSFSQNTSHIFSDLDFAIMTNKNKYDHSSDIPSLKIIYNILIKKNFCHNLRLIRARVPILKGICKSTGISVDISVNRENGYKAAGEIRNILEKNPILKPVIIILKILLRSNKLNDAHTGGMSSFLLFHLVYFFYIWEQKNKINENNNETNINLNNDLNNIEINEEINKEYSDESENENNVIENSDENNNEDDDEPKITKNYITDDDEEEMSSNVIKNHDTSDSNNNSKNEMSDDEIEEEKNDEINNESESDSDCEIDSDNDNIILENNINKNNIRKNNNEINIGKFLLGFLKFYSEFDDDEMMISLYGKNKGKICFKEEREEMDYGDYITVESIEEKDVDIGRSCFQYEHIKFLFKNVYEIILNSKKKNVCSILNTLNFPSI